MFALVALKGSRCRSRRGAFLHHARLQQFNCRLLARD
jgi:hypothetical protein